MQRIGVDAVSVDRIALAVKRSGPGFLNKVYTPAEQAYCAGNDERLAGRWAAKEAVIKTASTPIRCRARTGRPARGCSAMTAAHRSR